MDDDYDDFDEYNDAADDWEAEAAEEEAREKEILEQKANIEEQKLKKRIKAPAKVKKEEEEETLAADIATALITMKEKASSAGEAMHLLGDRDKDARRLIADMPVKTEQDATELGEAIAKRLLTFSRSPHFNTMLAVVFQDLAHEFRTRHAANVEATRVHVSSEEAKRRIKKAKKAKAGNCHDDAATMDAAVDKEPAEEKKGHDALDFDAVNDAGGAAGVLKEEEDFM